MTTEWKDCTDPEELFRRKREGWEIQIQSDPGNDKYCPFRAWDGRHWNIGYLFRARPPQLKKMKTITLRKALMAGAGHTYTLESTDDVSGYASFVCWIGEPYTVEVPE